MLRTVTMVISLLLLQGSALARSPKQESLDALAKELGCGKSKSLAGLRVWCLGPRAFKAGTKPTAPRTSLALIGITVELERGKGIRRALLKKVHPSALALRRAGGKVFGKITSIKPSNKAERLSLGKAVAAIAAVLKGRAKRARIDQGLYKYILSLPKRASYPIKSKGRNEWRIFGASVAHIRKLGQVWISVEVPKAQNGVFLSLFTTRFTAR